MTAGGDRSEPGASREFNPNGTYHEVTFKADWLRHKGADYHAYRRAWREVPAEKRELPFPLHLDIETTNVCNLRCPMCPRTVMVEEGSFSPLGFMTREQFSSIIDQGVANEVKSIKLNYLGEPLSHKDVVWQVEYAKQRGVLDVMMNTNASLLTRSLSEALLAAGLDHLFVSFDAVSPGLFAERRVGTTLGRVADNVHQFVQLRDERYPGAHVRVSMVMYDDPLWQEQFAGLKAMWGPLVDDIGWGHYVARGDDRPEYPEVPGFHCAQPFQRMFLKFNGNVTVCCVDDQDEEVMGNWHREPLATIWNGERYRTLRRAHAEGRYREIAMCRRCYVPVSS